MAVAGGLVNTENSITVSGINQSGSNVGSFTNFYQDQHFKVSGLQTIASGAGVFNGVVSYVASGTFLSGGGVTFSGSYVFVLDAISGTANPSSGAAVLYYFGYHGQSGLGTGGIPILPPDVFNAGLIFKSGLVAVLSGSMATAINVSVSYSKGI